MSSFLTIPEVCAKLRIGERTAYELCRTGQLGGAVKVGGQWRVEEAAFEKWVKQGGAAANQPPKKPEARP